MDGRHEWRSASHKSSSLCLCCSDWMLRISSSVQNNLVSFDWFRTEAEHTTWPFINIDSYYYFNAYFFLNLHQHDSIVSTCLTEARDTKSKWEIILYIYMSTVFMCRDGIAGVFPHPPHFHAKGLLDQGLSMNTIGQKSGYMYIHVNLKKFWFTFTNC